MDLRFTDVTVIILYYALVMALCCTEPTDKKTNQSSSRENEKCVSNCSTASTKINPVTSPHCNQLTLYQPQKVLPLFQEERREFNIVGKKWTILQQWNEIGLAAVIWEAAIALTEYLESFDTHMLQGKRVIELGAGTGLAGMVASCLGTQSVVLTDKNITPAKSNLKLNIDNLQDKDVTVLELEWGITNLTMFNPPYDIVLAADVIYREDQYLPLIETLKDLSSEDTLILLSCKRRYARDDKFFELLEMTKEFMYKVVMTWTKSDDVKVYRLYRRSSNF